MRNTLLSVIFLGMATATGQALAQTGDAERGAELSATCMGCHGITGYRNAYPSFRVPKLGGQHTEYVVLALQGYRDGTRAHDTMHAQAATLSDQDIRDVAAFFASQGDVQPAATDANVATVVDKAATCVACHGTAGISPAPNWPILAGQYADYLEHALGQYRSGVRKDPVMGAQAKPLTDEDIRKLATWFAAQPGLFTIHYRN